MNIFDYAKQHENFISQLPGFILLSTLDNKIAYANPSTVNLFGFKAHADIVGFHYNAINCRVVEDAKVFIDQDKLVLSTKKITTIGLHRYENNDDWRIIFCEKTLLVNYAEIPIGILTYFKDITNCNLIDFSRFLFRSETSNSKINRKSFSYFIEDSTISYFKLSKRQLECLFYLLRGKSDKEIGNALSLSPRTIESYIDEIKTKMQCSTRSQVIEKAFQEGLFNMIPQSFLK